jgi:GTPase
MLTIANIFFMARKAKAEALIQAVKRGNTGDYIVEIEVNRIGITATKVELKIHLLGSEHSGKSTLAGVLISGKADNGNGLARTKVLRHKHEIFQGHTSSTSHKILGFDGEGRVTNMDEQGNARPWAEIVEASSKIINFIDVAGH